MQATLKLVLLLVMFVGFSQQGTSMTHAQGVTITIEKDSNKKSDSKKKAPFSGTRPSVDVAILLDTSNSMDGLIGQAKSQLWNIVQEFAKAKKKGKTPLLRVAVFEYGNSGLPASEGYIRQVVQLTDDLDKVSEALFALSTNGGDEYCGQIIKEAVKRLDWSSEPNAYKAIFIAGNEPFTQGAVDYRSACKKAIGAGIVVNTIHCGDYQQGINGKWKDGADIAEGEYLNINQDERVVHIKAPQDKIIIKLNNELNQTYLWYGSKNKREAYAENQVVQDANASGIGGLSSRAATKSSSLYRNVGRD
ncbi:secreted protein containing von Willebrand factor, type A domain protein, partial [Rhodopirellula maiorica SM1]